MPKAGTVPPKRVRDMRRVWERGVVPEGQEEKYLEGLSPPLRVYYGLLKNEPKVFLREMKAGEKDWEEMRKEMLGAGVTNNGSARNGTGVQIDGGVTVAEDKSGGRSLGLVRKLMGEFTSGVANGAG